ncbi:uncharacterized protein ACN427_011478 [Glossina fuscipes fuscipes]
MSPAPAMLTAGAEEGMPRREAEAVEEKERRLVRSPAVGPALIRDRGPGPGPDLDPDRDLVCHLDAEEKTIEELYDEMNQDGNLEVDDIRMRVNDAVDLGILKKMEKIGIAINFTASSPENTVPAIEDDEPGPSDANRRRRRGDAQTRSRSRGRKRAASRSQSRLID